ncbi:hypothetical protein J8F10_02860 [Gemmata sp. G18]|uniref:Uncharacterized protein n=1 Tax=Gemmata palustris TaxID=2822762 RepID=A0ABS5BKJ3_9BACT|nr:hypothetical protein [Gemmata palustris]MBP3954235.1 hypothetical protein [Gemmata palustris]
MRHLMTAVVAALALAVSTSSAFALRIAAPPPPAQMALTAPVVVTGKITAIEKDTVDGTSPYAGANDKVAYKVAVVKIDSALVGANNLTHIKIGFIPPAKADPNVKPPVGGGRPGIGRPVFQAPELKEGQQMAFFLTKHPTADFYVMPGMYHPVDITTDAGKKALEEVKKATAVLADPMKGLKSDKANVRTETAMIMVTKYRAYPLTGGDVNEVAIPAEESKLILKGIAEGDWTNKPRPGAAFTPNALNAFYQLGLTDKDGWTEPMFPQQQPGQPPIDFGAITKDAFVKWLAGAGKDYQIKKVVPKTTEK